MIGIGRNPMGNLVAHDYTLTYDLGTYLAQDLFSKWTGKKKDNAKAWGRVFPLGHDPKLDGNWCPYKLPAGVTLWVNLADKEVLTVIQEHINRQKFAERNAITICRRNILKKAFGVSEVGAGGTAPVVSWPEPDRNFERVASAFGNAQAGTVTIDGEPVNIDKGDERLSDKDAIDESLAGADDAEPGEIIDQDDGRDAEGDANDGVTVPDGGGPTQDAKQIDALRAECRLLIAELGNSSDEVAGALAGRLENLAALADCQDAAMLAGIKTALTVAKQKKAEASKKKPAGKAAANSGSLLGEPNTP
jgi:hypothetical protein